MIAFETTLIKSAGCSCINQFQLQSYFKRQSLQYVESGSIFDWAIVTPDSTLDFFEYLKAGCIDQVLTDRSNYVVERGRLKNTEFEGFYFWHERAHEIMSGDDAAFAAFAAKVGHLQKKFVSVSPGERSIFVWSNLQPNLKAATAGRPISWEAFRLTVDRYERIENAIRETFGASALTVFATRRDDADPVLGGRDNLWLFDLDRTDDHRGPKLLFGDVFDRIGVLQSGQLAT